MKQSSSFFLLGNAQGPDFVARRAAGRNRGGFGSPLGLDDSQIENETKKDSIHRSTDHR